MKVYEKPKVYIGNFKLSQYIALGNWDMQQVQKFEEYFVAGKSAVGLNENIKVSYAK